MNFPAAKLRGILPGKARHLHPAFILILVICEICG